jgi:hypothetical protein
MNRNSLMEMSGRAMHSILRLTLNKANDNPMMQELSFDGMNSEGRKIVERLQNYGITTMPLPRDQQQGGGQGGGGGGGTGGDGSPMQGPAAEGIALLIGGQRNHPVIIGMDDRRHRPMGLKPGESAQFDDQGMMTLIRRDAIHMLALDDQGDGNAPGQYASQAGGQQKQRYASIRHVVKQKQNRDQGSPSQNLKSWADSGVDLSKATPDELAEMASAPNNENYKHEGDTINTEMRTTANRIEFRSGDTVVGYYDKQAKKWAFMGEIHLGAEDASHPAYGVSGGQGMTTVPSGDGAVLVNATKPGPPTSMDTDPLATEQRIIDLERRIAELEARAT